MEKKTVSVRLSKDGQAKFSSIVNWYRHSIPVGRISRDAVMEEVIRFAYDAMKQKQGVVGSVQKVIKAPLSK